MSIKNTPQVVEYYAWDSVNGVYKTGDAANHTLNIVGDGVSFAPSAPAIEEVSASLKPGAYLANLTADETNYDDLSLAGISSTPGVIIICTKWANFPYAPAKAGDQMDLVDAPNSNALYQIKYGVAQQNTLLAVQSAQPTVLSIVSGVENSDKILKKTNTSPSNLVAVNSDHTIGTKDAVLATDQPNYAPAKAGDQMDIVDAPNSNAVAAVVAGLESSAIILRKTDASPTNEVTITSDNKVDTIGGSAPSVQDMKDGGIAQEENATENKEEVIRAMSNVGLSASVVPYVIGIDVQTSNIDDGTEFVEIDEKTECTLIFVATKCGAPVDLTGLDLFLTVKRKLEDKLVNAILNLRGTLNDKNKGIFSLSVAQTTLSSGDYFGEFSAWSGTDCVERQPFIFRVNKVVKESL